MRKADPIESGLGPRLRARGGRTTRQRRAIHGALAARHDHPSAEDLHLALRRRLPDLSLATVYRTLDVLVRAGLASRLAQAPGPARYDARVDDHDHTRCLGCGRIDDFDVPRRGDRIADLATGPFSLTAVHLELVGYCAACGLPPRGEGESA